MASALLLTNGTYQPGTLAGSGGAVWYYLPVTPGTTYTVNWNDSYQGTGQYSLDVVVSSYKTDQVTPYFTSVDSGYNTGQSITPGAGENYIYLKVQAFNSSSTGTFAVKVTG